MTILTEKRFVLSDDVDSFEFQLERLSRPRQANPEFVKKLKHRLLTKPRITVENRKQYKAFWIIAVGLFAGALAVFLCSQKSKTQITSE